MGEQPAPLVIAIDGPAASGKGTLGRRLAEHFGLRHLDTGLTYRAVGHALLSAGLPLDNADLAEAAAHHVSLSALDREILAEHGIGEAASRVAVMPGVRRILVAKQREFARVPPGAVLDGRDIGTVVCPEAAVKLYVIASPQVRARRRHEEIVAQGGTADYATILAEIERRDARDTGRTDSPLRPAADSHLIDTSEMGIEAAFRTALSIVEKVARAGKA
jgi:CMP/dCMP kinase